ncbi:hypothetical protein BI380_16205 [Delftia tsuruhatensis]|uniref:Uncharacterized protein n=1 Tax=Delftia tsuruhatensis TaxID=180282 RepID=A0ABM6E5H7_9BURK|nr:hypothetical protein BI380_16205 [Delftia tsuruhatensis]
MPAAQYAGAWAKKSATRDVQAEAWVEYLERAQGLDAEAVSLGYLLGRIGHHGARSDGLTATASSAYHELMEPHG